MLFLSVIGIVLSNVLTYIDCAFYTIFPHNIIWLFSFRVFPQYLSDLLTFIKAYVTRLTCYFCYTSSKNYTIIMVKNDKKTILPLDEMLAVVPGPRINKSKRHPLVYILTFVVISFLCGYKGYTSIAT